MSDRGIVKNSVTQIGSRIPNGETDSILLTNNNGKLAHIPGDIAVLGLLGPEKITNGDMSSSTGWTVGANWSIAGGVATRSTGAQGNLEQTSANMVSPLVIGETYMLSFDVNSVDVGELTKLTCGGVTVLGSINEVGFSNNIFTATSTDNLKFDPLDNDVALVIDNVSIKKITRKDLIVTGKLGVGVEPQYPLHVQAEDGSIGFMMEGTAQSTPWFAFRSNPTTSVGASTGMFRYDGSNAWFTWTASFSIPVDNRIFWGAASQGSIGRVTNGGFVVNFREGITLTSPRFIKFGIDSIPHKYGTGEDTFQYYNGEDFVISPQEVGSGKLLIGNDICVGNTSSLGAELLTDGDFSAGGGAWTSVGWTIAGGDAQHDTGNTDALSQSVVTREGKLHRVVFDVTSNAGNNGLTVTFAGYSQVVSTQDIRTISVIVRADGASETIAFTPTTNSTVTIDNVSIKEMADGDLYVKDVIASNEVISPKAKMTSIGGYAVAVTNKTGANSVAGEVVRADTVTADAVILTSVSGLHPVGVFLDSGIPDDNEAWIVVAGIAEVRMDAGGCAIGDRIITSATAGRGDVNNAPAVAVHFQEIGHAIQVAVANANARCFVHFL